jgi:hypothetical protein
MTAWHEAAHTARTNQNADIPALRRHTQASVGAGHRRTACAPTCWNASPPAVILDATTAARIDAELTPFTGRARRALAEGGR